MRVIPGVLIFQQWADLGAGFWRGVFIGLALLFLLALYLFARAAFRGELPAWRAALIREYLHPLRRRPDEKADDEG